eukprot:TRINITY_DN33315_c0_g1_i1.p1 TRINITY_DN33315_c0_g1~~TRINITY_DN33315_c0_g1_i1.p1  ORF type:complete len:1234 (-),score=300.78 TRINITY_DN33315_c0_g1_i1:87-3788(-)
MSDKKDKGDKGKKNKKKGDDLPKQKAVKPKVRDPLDWEDDTFPKMADRQLVIAKTDPEVLRQLREKANVRKYIESVSPERDPARQARQWKFNFNIYAIENQTPEDWEIFMAVSEIGPKFEQLDNRLHGDFQYTKAYNVRSQVKKTFSKMELVFNKDHEFSYEQMKKNTLVVDVWQVSKLRFNNLIGVCKKSYYDLASDNVWQKLAIKAHVQAGYLSDEQTYTLGNVFILCLCSEVRNFGITLSNWQFLPDNPTRDSSSSKKKLLVGIPLKPKGSNVEKPTEECEPPIFSWRGVIKDPDREGEPDFIFRGTRQSLSNEVMTVKVFSVSPDQKVPNQWVEQGTAIMGLAGAFDYPIAVGTVKKLVDNVTNYVQGRVGGSLALVEMPLKKGIDEDTTTIPKPVQEVNSLVMYYLRGNIQYLVVTVHSADGLPVADADYGSSNAFVRVKYDGVVQQSPVIMDSLTPCWNHTFFIPVYFIDPKIYTDDNYRKTIFPEEMKSKGYLELEIWHWDGVPTEFLGIHRLDMQKVRFGISVERSVVAGVSKTRAVIQSNDRQEEENDDGDTAAGMDAALSAVHTVFVYQGRRERLNGSSLATQATPTINFDCFFIPDFPEGFKFPVQDDEEVAGEKMLKPSYDRWNEQFRNLNDAYTTWFPDSPPKRRWLCNFTPTTGKLTPLARLLTPLALPEELSKPMDILHWVKCLEFQSSARQRATAQIAQWQIPEDTLALRRGAVQDHAVLLCCALMGLKKDAWVCIGSLQGGEEHAWVMTREAFGTITMWEPTTGAKFHLEQRWIGSSGDKDVETANKRFKDRKATQGWRSPEKLRERDNFSRQQHLTTMDELFRLPIAPWQEFFQAAMIVALPYMSIEVIFNHKGIYGNLLNHDPSSIYYDMEVDKNSWYSLVEGDLKEELTKKKAVAIPVGAGVSENTAEELSKNIVSELKESIRMIRTRYGFESIYEDSEVRDEALTEYLDHLEDECKLDADWAYSPEDALIKPWGASSPFNNAKFKTSCRQAWSDHWQKKKELSEKRVSLPVKENHVMSGIPLHFSSSDLKEIRKCILLCKPIQEYFRLPMDNAYFFVSARVYPLPSSVSSVWVFIGAEIPMSKERILEIANAKLDEYGKEKKDDDDDSLELVEEKKTEKDSVPVEEKLEEGVDLFARSGKKVEEKLDKKDQEEELEKAAKAKAEAKAQAKQKEEEKIEWGDDWDGSKKRDKDADAKKKKPDDDAKKKKKDSG